MSSPLNIYFIKQSKYSDLNNHKIILTKKKLGNNKLKFFFFFQERLFSSKNENKSFRFRKRKSA